MQPLHIAHKNSLFIAMVSVLISAATLISCGGGGSSDSIASTSAPANTNTSPGANVPPSANVPANTDTSVVNPTCVPDVNPAPGLFVVSPAANVPSISTMPKFDLNGFTKCSDGEETLDLKNVKTHVAFGSQSNNDSKKLVYLFNQTGPIKFTELTFASDPLPGRGKSGYCKQVAKDNNDIEVFNSALAFIRAHLDGKLTLTTEQLVVQRERLKQTMHAVAESKEALQQAFSIIAVYEKMRNGAFFINEKTKNGFPNEYYGNDNSLPDGEREIDRAVLAVQQGLHDVAFTSTNLAKHKSFLKWKKFNSSDFFPGKVKDNVKANSCTTYSAKINATMAKDVDLRTAYSQYFARRPTGYYLAAGDIARVTVPATMVNKGFIVQVGAHIHDKALKSTIKRPYRVTTRFPVVSEVTEIANPNGGGIYIDVPYLASAGDVTVSIQNAVPAPFFAASKLNQTTLAQWKTVQRSNPAPWADFMSDKYMMTLPTSWIYKYEDPVALMKDWDARMDVVSDYVGLSRIRNNYILYSIVDTNLNSDAGGIGYPTCNNCKYDSNEPTDGNNKSWFLVPGKDLVKGSTTEMHELGHAQLFSNFDGEGEAACNMFYVAAANQLYNKDIDQALGESMDNGPHLGREVAATNWMVTNNFRLGKPMDISDADTNEVRYQERGYAKYVEIAALFGWSKIGDYYAQENRVFKKEAQDAGAKLNSSDSRILRWSIAAGWDVTPLIHFWGVQPKDGAALSAAIAGANLKPSAAIYDRLLKYRSLIPMSNEAFQKHASVFVNKEISQINSARSPLYGEGWYFAQLNKYSAADGQAAQKAFDDIIAKYFPNGRP
jgi:hypothetical protein